MKISPKIIELARSIDDPQELVNVCQKEGIEINTYQAQRLIDMSEFTELEDGNLENIAGGICTPPNCPVCNSHDRVQENRYGQWGYTCWACELDFNTNWNYKYHDK